MSQPTTRKNRIELLDEAIPQFEQFIESRERYIKALELTVEALRKENQRQTSTSIAIRSSIDELVTLQQLSNTISTAVDPEMIVSTLIDLTNQVVPVIESNIFLFDEKQKKLIPFSTRCSERLHEEAEHQLEVGIVDWVLSENKTVVIPDLNHLLVDSSGKHFVIVPLMLRNEPVGIYVIHTGKHQEEFSSHDIQLLTMLANHAAAGVENCQSHRRLVEINTELKQSQAQMFHAVKLAAIGELAAGIVHEIKNPIQVLMMHMEMVQRGKGMPNWIEMFSSQVSRLADITKRLMNFSRNDSPDVPFEPVEVNRAVTDIVAMIAHEMKMSNTEVALSLSENLSPIMGNSNLLQQVLLNLIMNARDAVLKGGKITISTESSGFHVIIRVRDNGTGIEKETLPKIFNPFFTTKEPGKGTGLGLSICNKIVAQHKGEIRVESTVGEGTTFTIFLPFRRVKT